MKKFFLLTKIFEKGERMRRKGKKREEKEGRAAKKGKEKRGAEIIKRGKRKKGGERQTKENR